MTIIMVIMPHKQPFALVYDPKVKEHLRVIDAKYRSLIRTTIEKELMFDPEVETKNRKPLRPPIAFEADWELRLGPDNRFRVFYAVDPDRREVQILAVGVKERNRLIIGKEGIVL